MGSMNKSDRVTLRIIHPMNGNNKEFNFVPEDTASDVSQYVFDNWPEDWENNRVRSAHILRLIYQGRFIHGNVSLGALQLPLGKTTAMHIMARETLPEPNSQGQRNRGKTEESNCCVIL
ncbi:ubiquitin-like protein 3 [Strongylocentrotus purpuratus]|uniref:UBL3-like ubiquitin domain-containing protein n=1 Tax=Strongylocentrotus purpuratus TaxID=7668 RepID=A0A7M7G0R0_STRPU|nr:ubiquitin-like protein 3 [Strongylocentrotus purpuratus]|eukprot:XP_001177227.1 PREDICTED: ubiquitin-like protein 3 [Strongylocentrotus purpuratus]